MPVLLSTVKRAIGRALGSCFPFRKTLKKAVAKKGKQGPEEEEKEEDAANDEEEEWYSDDEWEEEEEQNGEQGGQFGEEIRDKRLFSLSAVGPHFHSPVSCPPLRCSTPISFAHFPPQVKSLSLSAESVISVFVSRLVYT